MEQQPLNERMAAAESILEQHDKQLWKHEGDISDLKLKNVEQDTTLAKLCRKIDQNSAVTEKNHEMLEELHVQGKTIKWLVTSIVTGIPAIISLYFTIKQLGLF